MPYEYITRYLSTMHAMVILAAIVFVALYKVKAGYGILLNENGLRFPTNWHGCYEALFLVMC